MTPKKTPKVKRSKSKSKSAPKPSEGVSVAEALDRYTAELTNRQQILTMIEGFGGFAAFRDDTLKLEGRVETLRSLNTK